MSSYITMPTKKTLMLIVLFVTMALSNIAKAQSEEENDLWVQPIDAINIVARKMIVGDLEVNLTPGFKVFDSNGKSVSSSVLKPGVVISTVLDYRDGGVFVSTITLKE